ncbi:MAG TPA: IS110 family transposase [Candidatus Sulfotelmatobacter sp.]|nr:IS110 family transposase [Candidatus Sulfotelmatobacter sp.]
MAYRKAGIDVHKKKLAVVVADVEVDDEYQFERRWYGSNPEQLQRLAEWLLERQVEEVVMESTAQYWKPLWGALERYWKPTCQNREGAGKMSGTLQLAQALSNRGRRGRKKDFHDAERLVKRLVPQELTLSFVPDTEQRLWRTLSRTRYQRTRDRVRLQNQLEALLEEAHIKLSSLVSDLLGVSARGMLHALADGETNPAALAALADQRLRATPAQLRDALGACTEVNPVYRRLVKVALADLQFVEQQIGKLDQETAGLLREHQDAVQRLAEVPGLGVDSAQQIIAEVGAKAATFASAKNLVSWVGACPGDEQSAGVNRSKRSPKGNRQMRRILNQAANAAVKHKGSIFEIVYRRLVLRLGHNKTIGAIAHRLCELIWIILHNGVHYEERGPAVTERSKRVRTSRMIRTLRTLGYRVEPAPIPA